VDAKRDGLAGGRTIAFSAQSLFIEGVPTLVNDAEK
jgi:hypothetical protein